MNILLALADSETRAALSTLARARGLGVSEEVDPAAARKRVLAESFEIVVIDMASNAWTELLGPTTRAAVVALYRPEETLAAVEAVRLGAADAWQLPLSEEGFELALERALARMRVRLERDVSRPKSVRFGRVPMVAESAGMRRVVEQVDRVASTPNTTLLVTGERDSGRERAALEVHSRSKHATMPFVTLDGLGSAKGGAAFLGTSGGHAGALADAGSGTLVLRNVERLEAEEQHVLHEVLRDRSYRPIGSEQDVPLRPRIVALADSNLASRVESGTFLEDLLYRLNVLTIEVPPLRERSADIQALANFFLEQLAGDLGRGPFELAPEAVQYLRAHDWTHNLRELRNAMERAALLADGSIVALSEVARALTDDDVNEGDLIPAGKRTLRSVEEAVIRRVLSEAGGNRSSAARILGVNRTTLYNKIRRYGIES